MQKNEKPFSVNHTAHDLNNILTRILNSVELIKKKVPELTEITSLLSSIENGAYMVSEILEDLLYEPSDHIIRKKRININNLIKDLVNTVSIHLKDRINFSLRFEPSLTVVEGRYSDFYRVFMNLIINASEAINDNGIITIITSNYKPEQTEPKFFEGGAYIQIKVIDNGKGIDSSIMPFIFDEKFTTKSKIQNTGIGLSIVKKIIDNYNGSIKVKSEKNKGAEFTILIPSLPQIIFSEINSSKKIFIVEDEAIQRELLMELLRSYNFNVTTFENSIEAISVLKKKVLPDLLIIDQKLPDMDGLTCIKKIREMRIKVPIILASGSMGDEIQNSEVSKTVDKIICKPYDFDEMLTIIKGLLN
jgi:CheY-like chemotaxis protein